MTQTPERQALDVLLSDLQAGRADEVLDEILEAATARKAELDKWHPINDLLDMLRRIESVNDSMEAKARLGTEMHMQLKKYLEYPDPAVRGLAGGIRQRIYIDLLGMRPEQVAGL